MASLSTPSQLSAMQMMSPGASESNDARSDPPEVESVSISGARREGEELGVPRSVEELSPVPGSPAKDVVWSDEEDERVCRVCCCQEPDPAGEEALAVLGIASHIPLLEEQLQEAKRRRSLSRNPDKTVKPPDLHAGSVERSAVARGSFRGLAADLARRIFQKEEGPGAGDGAPSLRRANSLSCGVPHQSVLSSRSLPRPGAEHGIDLEQGLKAPERPPKQTAKPSPETVQRDEVGAPQPGPLLSATSNGHTAGDPPVEVVPGGPRSRSQLLQLGCHCQGDLALCHYACFLRWVVSRGPSAAHCDNQCEICGQVGGLNRQKRRGQTGSLSLSFF